jgi:hypothetical protein
MHDTPKKSVQDKAIAYNKQRGRKPIPGAFDALTPKQQKRLRKQIHKGDA